MAAPRTRGTTFTGMSLSDDNLSPGVAMKIRSALLTAIMVGSAACQHDSPSGLEAGSQGFAKQDNASSMKVALCHVAPGKAHEIRVARPASAVHLSHGDYPTHLRIEAGNNDPDNVFDFARISDAIAAARWSRIARNETESGSCRINIDVGAGTFVGTAAAGDDPSLEQLPMIIDVPDITLRGAMQIAVDADGRATPNSQNGLETIITASAALTSIAQFSIPLIVVNGHPGGSAGNGVVIEGFVFRSGREQDATSVGGAGIVSLRVQDLFVRGNRFENGFSEGVDLRASTGTVALNHLSGPGGTCDICLAGPGSYVARNNKLMIGGIPGILTVPALLLPVPNGVEQFALPASAAVTVLLENNEVRDHQRVPVGVGLRVGAVGVGAPNVAGRVTLEARNNVLVHNRFGMIIEAAFPVLNTLRRGDVDVTLSGNVFQNSCQADLFITLGRHSTTLGVNNFPYLLDSHYNVMLNGNVAWENVWYGNPAGFGNTLTVDGVPIGNDIHHAYDPSKACG